ncbi:MAG TPA: CHAD domain-containing protein [Granulicella sp.]|jgi:CHAD domain-containing protein|nr:CHAD domain-containing protein [Granulicella sp.]
MAQARTNRTKARRPGSAVVSPVAQLREQVTRLDAAMIVCHAAPRKEPVHSLRKATRYVEAQLALLELIPGLPPHSGQAKKVLKRLKTVRRAAGNVRDFDVQRDLIKSDRPAENARRENTAHDHLRRDVQALSKHLKQQRDRDAAKLTAVLRAEELKLAKALQKLEDTLSPAGTLKLPAARLAVQIASWFHKQTPHLPAHAGGNDNSGRRHHIEQLDEDALHRLRKASKLGRYMAESLPADFAGAKRLAGLFERLQESGGQWHDWLLLREIAAQHQGKRAELAERYAEYRDRALAGYRSQLTHLLPTRRAPVTQPSQ